MQLGFCCVKIEFKLFTEGKLGFFVVRLSFLALFTLFFSVLALPSQAGLIEGTSCDVEVYDVLSERARLETRREMEMAQKYIMRPDSVLEYSCFAQRRNELINHGLFWSRSESVSSGGIDQAMNSIIYGALMALLGDTDFTGVVNDIKGIVLDAAIDSFGADPFENLVDNPLQRYLMANFYHSLAGGHYDQGATGLCNAMDTVWRFLKCSNFDPQDFITFDSLAVNDLRTLPVQCSLTGREDSWNSNISAAFPAASSSAQSGGMTALNLRNYVLNPAKCTDRQPIPTGVQVIARSLDGNRNNYPDMICLGLGCYYKPTQSGNGTGSCRALP